MTIKRRVFALSLASIVLLAAGQMPGADAQISDSTARAVTSATMTDTEVSPSAAEVAALDSRAAMLREATVPLNDGAAITASVSEPAIVIDNARPVRLSQLVSNSGGSDLSEDMKCLATAVYFEARGEPLEGQLAVAEVILNRVASGRFASTVCGVVYQPGQFTFARDRAPSTSSLDWKVAQAIAVVASSENAPQVAPRAISFHAARLTPGWTNLRKVSQIGNHVFYR